MMVSLFFSLSLFFILFFFVQFHCFLGVFG